MVIVRISVGKIDCSNYSHTLRYLTGALFLERSGREMTGISNSGLDIAITATSRMCGRKVDIR
jgi:hypothetical protein